MRVPDEKRRKEIKKGINLVSIFSFFLLISLCFSVFYSITPVLAAADNEKKFSIIPADKSSLSIIAINGEEIYIRSGYSHDFLQDYQLYVKGADTEGKRVWIELSRNGVPLQDDIVTEGSQFVYSQNSTEILNLTVDMIYEGADGVLVKFSPVYQYIDPRLPVPQTPTESIDNSSNNNTSSSADPELETQAEGFDMPLFLLGMGAMILVTGFFAGKVKRK
ncbi:S-layer protein domain-containing protein [Methanosarcina sp.]|uniref:S-layer protein domain-containing protein n=1 Tax=Methanosarcina sp. TaxID=2213 RepID=UPI00298853C8|nr:S-layer protein domain-containing protein [Methanosarcina sp.]MDW5552069.1 S-layer protein domain-containing protein [Methanosarcina sp.]MDW5555816.1 S-layer protein domain-containing protein [Methanosarcina sp.]MDW5558705.1 S-layer protein domain-containing protein [Methanosarcina sp.]